MGTAEQEVASRLAAEIGAHQEELRSLEERMTRLEEEVERQEDNLHKVGGLRLPSYAAFGKVSILLFLKPI